MGVNNSTDTRVGPVFDKLMKKDNTGKEWLERLIRLPKLENTPSLQHDCNDEIRCIKYGKDERSLEPPVSLLSWIIRHPRKPLNGILSKDPRKEEIRRRWLAGSEEVILDGLTLLTNNPDNENWHLFEGPSKPDVYIETDDIIIVIEGKRTELGPTTDTKWMKGRHQMFRHIDCAWEQRVNRRVLGFFIVEGEGPNTEVPSKWRSFAKETINTQAIMTSLPHRGPEEQREIASAFIGVTTWQKVCEAFGDLDLNWSDLPR